MSDFDDWTRPPIIVHDASLDTFIVDVDAIRGIPNKFLRSTVIDLAISNAHLRNETDLLSKFIFEHIEGSFHVKRKESDSE